MVRFKVYKGSKLLLIAAAALLAIVVLVLVFTGRSGKDQAATASAGVATEVVIPIARDVRLPFRVLIYHTHTNEAYQKTDADDYVETEEWRTRDPEHSILRVGSELAELLRGMGIDVVHDTTDHEQDELSTAYSRSLSTLEGYEEHFDLYIDLHRDAYHDGAIQTVPNGTTDCARLMFMIGRGDNYLVKPDFAGNLAAAEYMTDALNESVPGICQEVLQREGRYNQHMGRCVLIEIGNNRNTLEEALASLPVLAEVISDYLNEFLRK